MITITEAAAAQIKASSSQDGMEKLTLRLSARAKSDGSLDYLMGFDEQKETDIVIQDNDVEVLIAKEDEDMLAGTTMDFVELAEGESRFIFANPSDSNYTPSPKKFKS